MTSPRFVVAVYVVGMAVALATFAYLLDHARATAHVERGLGEAADPEREEALAVLEETRTVATVDVEAEFEAARTAKHAPPAKPAGLVVRVVDEDGRKVSFVDVLAYRGDELLRAGNGLGGTVSLVPFDGPASLRVELNAFEVARSEIPDGRGFHEIVVPRLPCVSGVVLVGGVPRRGIQLALTDGSDGWLDRWIDHGLWTVGLDTGGSRHQRSTEEDGSFRYVNLPPDWSGVLSLTSPEDHRLVSGGWRIELARPEEGLVLQLEALRPEVELRGRVVLAGEPVPRAVWRLGPFGSWESCDELGRFSIHLFPDATDASRLELKQRDLGERTVELGAVLGRDLGDVELLPYRRVRFVVRSESGAPIAGARAITREPAGTSDFERFIRNPSASEPTDAAGEGVLESLRADAKEIRVSARGYESTFASVPEDKAEPISVVLPRCAAFHVVVRDRSGRVPRGVFVRLEAREPAFTGGGGDDAWEAPWLDRPLANWGRCGDGFTGEYFLEARGGAWIDPPRADVPLDLSAVDAYGTVLASAPGLVLAPGEWRQVDFRVEAEPRTLLVHVRDTLGHPLGSALLEVEPAGCRTPRAATLRTDRAGMARTEPLYADDVTLRVSRDGFESRTLEHVHVPPEGATVDIRLAHDWWSW